MTIRSGTEKGWVMMAPCNCKRCSLLQSHDSDSGIWHSPVHIYNGTGSSIPIMWSPFATFTAGFQQAKSMWKLTGSHKLWTCGTALNAVIRLMTTPEGDNVSQAWSNDASFYNCMVYQWSGQSQLQSVKWGLPVHNCDLYMPNVFCCSLQQMTVHTYHLYITEYRNKYEP